MKRAKIIVAAALVSFVALVAIEQCVFGFTEMLDDKANLATLRGIYVDCGWRDQYHIHYGTRILSQRLTEAGIRHTYEEFDDDHSDVDYRMDVSLPFLYRALKP
jgi:hypothetical protein